MTYTLYSRSSGSVFTYFVYAFDDGSVHAGWTGLVSKVGGLLERMEG